jgi:hypothetical protein
MTGRETVIVNSYVIVEFVVFDIDSVLIRERVFLLLFLYVTCTYSRDYIYEVGTNGNVTVLFPVRVMV